MRDEHVCCPSHCCDQHGCKYGMDDCPVKTGEVKQLYPCETCGLTESGFYEGLGYYDSSLAWHPPPGSVDYDREVEDRVLRRAAAFFRRELSDEQKADPEKVRMYAVTCRVADMLERREFEE